MIKNYVFQFYILGLAVETSIDNHQFRRFGIELFGSDKVPPLSPAVQEQVISGLKATERACRSLGLDVSAKQIHRILALPNLPVGLGSDEAARQMQALRDRLIDELESLKFLHLTPRMAECYSADFPFGEKVAQSFPNAIYDIEESAKCFALARSTACVMHLMRALEAALDAIGLGLGIPNVVVEAKNSWGGMLRIMRDTMQQKNKAPAPDWIAQKGFYEDAHAHLSSVKTAWRDPSMHLDKKYDEKDAMRIYTAVQDFMQHLAAHLDHAGNFTS